MLGVHASEAPPRYGLRKSVAARVRFGVTQGDVLPRPSYIIQTGHHRLIPPQTRLLRYRSRYRFDGIGNSPDANHGSFPDRKNGASPDLHAVIILVLMAIRALLLPNHWI